MEDETKKDVTGETEEQKQPGAIDAAVAKVILTSAVASAAVKASEAAEEDLQDEHQESDPLSLPTEAELQRSALEAPQAEAQSEVAVAPPDEQPSAAGDDALPLSADRRSAASSAASSEEDGSWEIIGSDKDRVSRTSSAGSLVLDSQAAGAMMASVVSGEVPVEVERKFIVPDNYEALLKSNGFSLLTSESEKLVDEYFDTRDHLLLRADHWLRKRNGDWQLKYPLAADDTAGGGGNGDGGGTVIYHESSNADDILAVLQQAVPGLEEAVSLDHMRLDDDEPDHPLLTSASLVRFAALETNRQTYKRGNVTIVIDGTDWGYRVGEIEVMVAERARVAEAARLIEVIAKNLELRSIVEGKIAAYLCKFNPCAYTLFCEMMQKRHPPSSVLASAAAPRCAAAATDIGGDSTETSDGRTCPRIAPPPASAADADMARVEAAFAALPAATVAVAPAPPQASVPAPPQASAPAPPQASVPFVTVSASPSAVATAPAMPPPAGSPSSIAMAPAMPPPAPVATAPAMPPPSPAAIVTAPAMPPHAASPAHAGNARARLTLIHGTPIRFSPSFASTAKGPLQLPPFEFPEVEVSQLSTRSDEYDWTVLRAADSAGGQRDLDSDSGQTSSSSVVSGVTSVDNNHSLAMPAAAAANSPPANDVLLRAADSSSVPAVGGVGEAAAAPEDDRSEQPQVAAAGLLARVKAYLRSKCAACCNVL